MWGAFFYPHEVAVRPLLGAGGMGVSFGPSRVVAAEVRDKQQLVRGKDGAEVVSSAQVTVAASEVVPIGSMVTVWQGLPQEREAVVLAASLNTNEPPLDAYLLLFLE